MTHEEQLETIRRIANASGIRVAGLTAVEAVKLLGREHVARGAMVAVLDRQARQVAIAPAASMYTSAPLPARQSAFYAGERYIADAELARRERLDLAATEWQRPRLTLSVNPAVPADSIRPALALAEG